MAELSEIVGEDLFALIRERALPVVSAARVSTLWSPSWNRAAFRLRLADGSSCKARRFESNEAADRVAVLGPHLPAGSCPRTIAVRGVARLDEWVDGAVLSSGPIAADSLRRIGAIVRAIHAVALTHDVLDESARRIGATWRDTIAARVEDLCQAGVLTRAEGARALDLVDAHAPADVSTGLVHGDICPENIVIDLRQAIRIIDNDSIALRPPEFDLARIWYRWPMTADERRVFEDGYGPCEVLTSYRAHFLHWAIAVLVRTAEFRMRHQLPGVEAPVERLRAIFAGAARRPRRACDRGDNGRP